MLTDGRTTDDRVTGILIAHLGAFGSGELKMDGHTQVTMLQLAIMNHRLIMLDDEVQARGRLRAKRFWVRPCMVIQRHYL